MKKIMKTLKISILLFLALSLPISAVSAIESSDFSGEKIEYDIKKYGIDSGDATLEFFEGQKDGDEDLDLIVFRAMAINFLDEEKIYVDPIKMLPIRVERNLNIFGLKEKIVEYYDSQEGTVRIVKTAGGKTTEQVIKKEGELDNIYCFIYRYRKLGGFELGDTLAINLPTQDVEIELKDKTNLKTAGRKFDTYFMQTNPKKYKVWFDDSSQKIPLRIDGSVGFGSTYMVMTKYQKEDFQIGK